MLPERYVYVAPAVVACAGRATASAAISLTCSGVVNHRYDQSNELAAHAPRPQPHMLGVNPIWHLVTECTTHVFDVDGNMPRDLVPPAPLRSPGLTFLHVLSSYCLFSLTSIVMFCYYMARCVDVLL